MTSSRRLNKVLVVEKAIELADQAGDPAGLTLTALAGALEIQVPSLYNHIAGRQALQRELALAGLRMLLRTFREAIAGKVGRAALVAIARAYRDFAAAHPGLYPLTLQAPAPGDGEITALSEELIQLLLLVLATTRIEGEPAYHAIRGLRSILHGFVSLEAAQGFELLISKDESFDHLVNTYLDGLEIE
jgi:AcrR family transcriptional regulator